MTIGLPSIPIQKFLFVKFYNQIISQINGNINKLRRKITTEYWIKNIRLSSEIDKIKTKSTIDYLTGKTY